MAQCLRTAALLLMLLLSKGWGVERLPPLPHQLLQYVSRLINVDPIIIECGGCNGDDSERMARVWPKGKIYTFEPVPVLFNEIKQRARLCPNIFPFQIALAERTEQTTFHLSTMDTNIGASSLFPPTETLSLFDPAKFCETIEVCAMTLDDWARENNISKVDFLWLDMQGSELNMLMASEIAKTAKAIYTEVEFLEIYQGQYLYSDVKAWMLENGFELYALDFDEESILAHIDEIRPGNRFPYAGNALFVRKASG